MPESMRDCPACHTRVLPTADQLCPACRRYSFGVGGLIASALAKPASPRPAGWAVDRTLTVLIIVFGVFTALATVVNLVAAARGHLAAILPAAPLWARSGVLALGLGGLLGLAGLVGLWKRRRWGLYLFDAAALGAFVLNLKLGVGLAPAILGLLGAATLSVFAVFRWRDFN
jgi:hypothetical protein